MTHTHTHTQQTQTQTHTHSNASSWHGAAADDDDATRTRWHVNRLAAGQHEQPIMQQWRAQQLIHMSQQMMYMHNMIEMLQEQNRTLNTEKSNSLKMTHLLLFRALFSDNSCCKACA
jgi:hypothetical protein